MLRKENDGGKLNRYIKAQQEEENVDYHLQLHPV
jgi:hypothetical protein